MYLCMCSYIHTYSYCPSYSPLVKNDMEQREKAAIEKNISPLIRSTVNQEGNYFL